LPRWAPRKGDLPGIKMNSMGSVQAQNWKKKKKEKQGKSMSDNRRQGSPSSIKTKGFVKQGPGVPRLQKSREGSRIVGKTAASKRTGKCCKERQRGPALNANQHRPNPRMPRSPPMGNLGDPAPMQIVEQHRRGQIINVMKRLLGKRATASPVLRSCRARL